MRSCPPRVAFNVAVVVMANKMARTIWALTAHERKDRVGYVSQPLRAEITLE
jgi:transposase